MGEPVFIAGIERGALRRPSAQTFPRRAARSAAIQRRSAQEGRTYVRHLAQRSEDLATESRTPGTHRVKESHFPYWEDFCERTRMDPDAFALEREPSHETRCHEEDVMTALLIFVSENPRAPSKRSKQGTPKGRNSTGYAGDVVSSIRLWFEERRGDRVGMRSPMGQSAANYRAVRKALTKLQPGARPARQPVLAQHMRRLHAVLDFDSHFDRTCWCLAISCWVGVRRVGDWLADPAEAAKGWRPHFRSHRGRISVRPQANEVDAVFIIMKPPKEDAAGEVQREAVFTTGPWSECLSAGNAWSRMLQGDRTHGSPGTATPIFRHQETGAEISKEEFRRWFVSRCAKADMTQFGSNLHSLRIGGATTLAETVGPAAARGVGGWLSDADLLYMHMSAERRMELGAHMARQDNTPMGDNSRPIGRRPGA